jgi:hypothetical protein
MKKKANILFLFIFPIILITIYFLSFKIQRAEKVLSNYYRFKSTRENINCTLINNNTIKCWTTNTSVPVGFISSKDIISVNVSDLWYCVAIFSKGKVKCEGRLLPTITFFVRNISEGYQIAASAGNWFSIICNFSNKDNKSSCSWFLSGLSCEKEEAYNPEKRECIKKGIGCYTNDECFNIYKNQSVVCYGSIIGVVTTPGHCCLKDEIWNGSACIKRKFRVVVIPYKEDLSKIGASERDIEETIGNVLNYYPIGKEKLEVVVWKTPCNPIFDQLWPICPSFVGAAGHGDRYILVTDKNEDLSSECGTGEAEGCAVVNGVSVIVREFIPTIVAHELGHTFGLQDEYCHYKHPIGGWKCGTEAYPNPLKPEYGCRVFPLPRCENAKLETEKQTASPGEWIKLNIKDLQGNACGVYKAQIETFKNGKWQPLTSCIPGEPCYVSFSENEKGTNKIRAKLVLAGYTSSYETITNEVEINVEGSTTKPKIFGYSCSDEKLLLNLNSPFTMYWEVYGNGKEIWFRVEKNSNFSYELDGKFEMYDASCNKIGESKVKIEKNGIYNVKVYGPTTSTLLPLSIEKFGFCCWDANVYYPTCFGDKPTTGNGRSIMAYPLQATNFSQPAWEHLKKVMGIWEES